MTTEGHHKAKQFNFNSIVGIVCTGLVGLALAKLDHMYTSTVRLEANLEVVSGHMKELDVKMAELVTRGELKQEQVRQDQEAAQQRQEIIELKNEVKALEGRNGGIKP